ncbi:hypothetical protein WH50_08315 [Pokkaliibacter plantistimulans]|uniref:DUF1043 family protein n=1 Tax=Pokkaliibacter plantistimulans TaxID=1635171 RepID=A0ABX5M009_9GAMM|nr:DUF1043 family protein [Pokkaliibacter plantistimulans]PXF31739.1 hypothetical protein WH50_08315 [Pokkaliibacter plantistimulans]
MEQFAQIILIAAIAFIVGLIVGRLMPRQPPQKREIESFTGNTATQQELITYRADVQNHLDSTVTLFNQLLTNVEAMHSQLNSVNSKLGDGSTALRPLATVTQTVTDNTTSEAEPSPIQQPRDYVPKSSPNDVGTLAEGFGLRAKEAAQESTSPRID